MLFIAESVSFVMPFHRAFDYTKLRDYLDGNSHTMNEIVVYMGCTPSVARRAVMKMRASGEVEKWWNTSSTLYILKR